MFSHAKCTHYNGMGGEGTPSPPDKLDKMLGVSVGDVQTDERELRDGVKDEGHSLKVFVTGTRAHRHSFYQRWIFL